MAATVDLHRVITRARRVGAQVILVGDHHQLPEIGAGGVFAAAVDLLGSDAAELTINRRQQAEWEHAALDELRHGNPHAGFRAYHDHGQVTIATTTAEVHQQAVAAWADAHRAGVNGVLLAGTRNEAKALNRLARQQVADELSGRVLEVRGRQFQAGDRVVLLRNSPDSAGHIDLRYRRPTRVDNGMIGTIHRIRRDGRIDLKLVNGTPICVAADYVAAGHIDHGYATTIHKAQGITCDRMFLVGPAGLYREAVYVAMSRARHGSHLYATASQAAELVERPHTAGIPLPAEHVDELDFDVSQAVAQSRAKTLASLHDPLLPTISRIADEYHLDWLWNRHVHVRHTTAQLVADGYTDPTTRRAATRPRPRSPPVPHLRDTGQRSRLGQHRHRHRRHRQQRHRRRRVRLHHRHEPPARSWNGPTSDPSTTPNPPTPPPNPTPTSTSPKPPSTNTPPTGPPPSHAHGIHPDEAHLLPAAIAMRRQRLTLALAGEAPGWLTYWYGPRPVRPHRRPSLGRRDQPTRRLARRPPPRPHHPRLRTPTARSEPRPAVGRTPRPQPRHPRLAPRPHRQPAHARYRSRPTSPPCGNGSPNSTSSWPTHPSTRPGSSPPSTTANSTPPTSTRHSRWPPAPRRNDASGSSSTGRTSSNTPNSPS